MRKKLIGFIGDGILGKFSDNDRITIAFKLFKIFGENSFRQASACECQFNIGINVRSFCCTAHKP